MFVIEKIIFYDPKNNLIWHNEIPEEQISVPPTASRLLELLIQNHGKILSRKELLDSIWTQYGISPSNNTLNQYISLLRGVFEKLGLQNDVIVTIPRKGFMLKEEINIETHFSDISDQSGDDKKTKHKILKKTISLKVFFLLVVLVLSTLLCISLFYGENNFNLYKLGISSDCPVYTLHEDSEYNDVIKMEAVGAMIREYAPCRKGDIFIFHPSDSVIVTGHGPAFLTRCSLQKDGSGRFEGCYDVYKFATK